MKTPFILLLIFFAPFVAHAEQTLVVENIWIREAPPSVSVLAAYMTLNNPTDQDITLICADSPTFEDIMFHKTSISDGIAKMRHADEIIIPANSSFELRPGNYHLMLIGKNKSLKEGDNVELTLIFKNIENQKITATVKKSVAE